MLEQFVRNKHIKGPERTYLSIAFPYSSLHLCILTVFHQTMSPLVWLVTGCSSGFGRVFVEQILARGDRVIATARRAESIEDLRSNGAAVLQLDVTSNQETVNEIMAKAIAIYGHIDVLVNNAAYIAVGAWEDVSLVTWLSFQRAVKAYIPQ